MFPVKFTNKIGQRNKCFLLYLLTKYMCPVIVPQTSAEGYNHLSANSFEDASTQHDYHGYKNNTN